jgi:lysophospholipase L1-like esterase
LYAFNALYGSKIRMKEFFTICSILFYAFGYSQPYADEVAAFKKQDSISFPATNQILFIGSSSFTNWIDVKDYFPAYKILNRGFGGSSLLDLIRYKEDIIFPYKPKQIVIYCGENDIAGDSTVTGKIVHDRFVQLYQVIRTALGNVPIAYISMKPSPSRWHLRQQMMNGNKRIETFLKNKKRNGKFINIWNRMLDKTGKPKEEIFLEDKLHMNAKGYTIWQTIIQPCLIK